jgi:hypothetical protein
MTTAAAPAAQALPTLVWNVQVPRRISATKPRSKTRVVRGACPQDCPDTCAFRRPSSGGPNKKARLTATTQCGRTLPVRQRRILGGLEAGQAELGLDRSDIEVFGDENRRPRARRLADGQDAGVGELMNLFQLRPDFPNVPPFPELRLSLFQVRHTVRERHGTGGGHRPEPAQIVGTATGRVNAANRSSAAVHGVVRSVLFNPGAELARRRVWP